MNIKVSVIISVYNKEKYLQQCLDSIINQTLKEIEIICVNDGSTDNSIEILKEYEKKDDRIIIIDQDNKGAASARNAGLKIAKGDYLYFMDSDDYLDLEALEILYNKVKLDDLDIICFDRITYHEDTDKKNPHMYCDASKLPNVFSINNVPDFYKYFNSTAWSKLFNRKFIINNEIEFQNQKTCNDIYFAYCAISLAERISIINMQFITWRCGHLQSTTFNRGEYWNCIFHAYEKLRVGLNNILSKNMELRDSFHKKMISHIYGEYKCTNDKNNFINMAEKSIPTEYLSLFYSEIYNVSVIIPVYNVEKYLSQCLDSVTNQTLKNIEIICVNDGSPDNSLKILEEYAKKDERIKIINQENRGLAGARNTGIKAAKGEYIGFIDSDDWVDLNYFETLYTEAKKHKADLARTLYKYCYSPDNEVICELYGLFQKKIENKQDLRINDHSLVVWNAIYKRDYLLKNNIFFDETHRINEDVLFTPKATYYSSKSIAVLGTYYYYRKYEEISEESNTLSYKGIQNIDNFIKVNKCAMIFMNSVDYSDKNDYITAYKRCLWRFDDRINKLNDVLDNNQLEKLFDNFINAFNEFKYKEELENEQYYNFVLNNDFEGYLKSIKEIIISLTSYPARIDKVHITIESLLNQTKKAYKVILWLAEEQFPNKEKDLPKNLLDLTKIGLSIEWCNDIKSYKKLIPALKKYSEKVIVTADDDIIYRNDFIEKLYKSYLENTEFVHCHRAHKICINNKIIIPYKEWQQCLSFNIAIPSFFNFPTTGGGVLYPPNVFYRDVFKEDLFMKLAPRADDIWFWAMLVLKNVKINIVKDNNPRLNLVEGSQEETLWHENVHKGGNDQQLSNIIKHYPEIMKKLLKENKVEFKDKKRIEKEIIKKEKKEIRKQRIAYIKSLTPREFIGKIRRKIIKLIIGRELVDYIVSIRDVNQNIINYNNNTIENIRQLYDTIYQIDKKTKDEMGYIKIKTIDLHRKADEINKKIYHLNNKTDKLDIKSIELKEITDLLNLKNDEMIIKTDELGKSIYHVDKKAEELGKSVYQINNKTDELGKSIYHVDKKAEELGKSVYQINNKTDELNQKSDNLIKKTDMIDKKTYEIKQKSDELIWANIFNSTIENSKWLKIKTFSPGRWAAGYPLLYILYRILRDAKPKNILELGLGETTKIISQYTAGHDDVEHNVVEHDPIWIDFFTNDFKISKKTKIINLPWGFTQYKEIESIRVYNGFNERFDKGKYDFICIDGPLAGDMIKYGRIDSLHLIPNNLTNSFVILIDDYNREQEKNMVIDLLEKLDNASIKYAKKVYSGNKDTLIICSEDNKFLTSV